MNCVIGIWWAFQKPLLRQCRSRLWVREGAHLGSVRDYRVNRPLNWMPERWVVEPLTSVSNSNLSNVNIPTSVRELGNNCSAHCIRLRVVAFRSPSSLERIQSAMPINLSPLI